MEFGWDSSIRAAARREGQAVSKWLQEENESVCWVRMDIDGERRGRVFGADVTNRGIHKEGVESVGHFIRQLRLAKEKCMIDISKQDIGEGEGVEMEDLQVEFVDGKKRQRFHLEVVNSLMEVGSKIAISVATNKLADRAQ